MNYAQTVTEEPTGAGTRWFADATSQWFAPKRERKATRVPGFPSFVFAAITTEWRTIHEVYAAIPVSMHSVRDYSNLNTQLSRLTKNRKIQRSGAVGHYRYRRLPK